MKGVTVFNYVVGNMEDKYSNDHTPNQHGKNSVSSTSKDERLGECVASLELSVVEIIAFVWEKKLREMKQ